MENPLPPITNADVLAFFDHIVRLVFGQTLYIALAIVFGLLYRAVVPGRWAGQKGGNKARERMTPAQIADMQAEQRKLSAEARGKQDFGGYDPREHWPIDVRRSDSGAAPVTDPGEQRWVVPDLIPYGPPPRFRIRVPRGRDKPLLYWDVKGYITMVLGGPGIGKSYVLDDLALAGSDPVVEGDWLGMQVEPCKTTLYVDCELDARTFWARMFAVGRGRLGRLESEGKTVPRKWRPKGVKYLRLYSSLASWQGQLEIRKAVRKHRPGRIIIDSATIGAWGLNAGDANGWRRTYIGLELIGVPIIIVDHLNKEGEKVYGSFIKEGLIRSILKLQKVDNAVFKASQEKTNFGKQIEDFWVHKRFYQTEKGLAVTFERRTLGAEPNVEDAEEQAERQMYILPD